MEQIRAVKAGLLLVATVGVFCAGRWSVKPSPGEARAAGVAMPASQHSPIPAGTSTAAPARPALFNANVAAAALAESEPAPSAPKDPVGHANASILRLRRLVPEFRPGPGLEPFGPGQRAQLTRPFVKGFAAAIAAMDPTTVAAVASEVTESFCGKDPPKGDQRVMFAQLAHAEPSVLTSEGLDCFLGRSKGVEDEGTWEMIQGWRTSGMEKTAGIAELEKNAQDPRTKDLFRSKEELAAIGERGVPSSERAGRTFTSAERTQAAQNAPTKR